MQRRLGVSQGLPRHNGMWEQTYMSVPKMATIFNLIVYDGHFLKLLIVLHALFNC